MAKHDKYFNRTTPYQDNIPLCRLSWFYFEVLPIGSSVQLNQKTSLLSSLQHPWNVALVQLHYPWKLVLWGHNSPTVMGQNWAPPKFWSFAESSLCQATRLFLIWHHRGGFYFFCKTFGLSKVCGWGCEISSAEKNLSVIVLINRRAVGVILGSLCVLLSLTPIPFH